MFIIYNLSGFVIGVLGLALGLLTLTTTESFSLALLVIALVWFVLSLLWRRWKTEANMKRPFPSIFFIPLPVWAIPVFLLFLLVFPLSLISRTPRTASTPATPAARVPLDVNAAKLNNDVKALDRGTVTGDAALSQTILTALQAVVVKEAEGEKFQVFTRVNPEAILVLIKAPNLSDFAQNARVDFLKLVEVIVSQLDGMEEKQVYIGIKGRIMFGAIKAPNTNAKTGTVVSDAPLRAFYTLDQKTSSTPQTADISEAPVSHPPQPDVAEQEAPSVETEADARNPETEASSPAPVAE